MIDDQSLVTLDTIGDFWRFAVSQANKAELFYGHGTDNAIDDMQYLISHVLFLGRVIPTEFLSAKLVNTEKKQLCDALHLRIKAKIPTAHIVNKAWFCDLPFYVNQNVIVPRSPIAELIQSFYRPFYIHEEPPQRILDLCTGSGCIGIASALAFPEAAVTLVDLSAAALQVANINIEQFNLTSRVHTLKSDLFDQVQGQFDLIVSNPPYVDAEDFAELAEEYRHEPTMALVSGENGLAHTLTILNHAAKFLTEQGIIFIEVGNSASALCELCPEVDFNWLAFESGGAGVFCLSRYELELNQAAIDRAVEKQNKQN